MESSEALEKARQEIMRFRELLDILKLKLESGERNYTKLFAQLPPESLQGLPEKEQQRQAAYAVLEDSTELSKAVLSMRLELRDMSRAFEELYDTIMTDYEE